MEKLVFNLSLDDFSPAPNTNNLYWANKLIEKFPDIKIDLFVPAAYCRLKDKYPYFLYRHLDWVELVKILPSNYKLNLHGLFHRRTKMDFAWHQGIESNNNEWENLTYEQAKFLLESIEKIFDRVGLKFSKVFRAPGFHLGYEATKLLTNHGYTITGTEEYKRINKSVSGLKYISVNWDLLKEPPMTEKIIAYGHTSSWNKNYLNEENYNKIVKILDGREVQFKFIEEL